MQPQQPIQQPQISLSQSNGITCECGSVFFKQVILLRKFSRFVVGTPTDQFVPVAVFRCDDCGRPSKELFPEGMVDIEEKFGWTKVDTIKPSDSFEGLKIIQ